jgi:hypothetical protein
VSNKTPPFFYWQNSPAALLRICAALPPAKGVTFAGCVVGVACEVFAASVAWTLHTRFVAARVVASRLK